ncbi:MAG: hypothetical protein JW866_06425 [Ignavibacteriales bacterium]|nr:hypothetical protein [Ignavibacteriales bacterium]
MKFIKMFFCFIFIFLSVELNAQAFKCTLEQKLNPTLDSLYISFYIQKINGPDFILGYAFFRVSVERTAVNIFYIPQIIQSDIWINNQNYSQMTAGRNIPNSWVSLEISGILPNGYVNSSLQLVGTISMPILNPEDYSGVKWFTSEVYDENSNLINEGEFINPGQFLLNNSTLTSP